jgi:hypothetical protein
MNDVYEINVAKASLREAYDAVNADLLLMAFTDEFTDMSSGKPNSLAPMRSLYFECALRNF